MRIFKSFYKFKNNVALVDKENKKFTYNDILKETDNIKKKISRRSLILVVSENSIGTMLTYIFCILNNHVLIIVDNKTENKNISEIINNYKPQYLFLSNEYKKYFSKFGNENYNFYGFVIIKNKIFRDIKLNNELSILLSTSGSMGSSKFVKLSKQNLKTNADSIIDYLKIKSSDAAITNLPVSYSYMLSIINTHLEVGGKIIITNNSLIEKNFWQLFNKNKITSFNGVPFTYDIIEKIGLKKIKNRSLRYLTSAGGKIENDKIKNIVNFCKKNKYKFFSMYGQTEASPRISYLSPKFCLKKIGSIGKGMKNTKIFLVDNNDKKILKPYIEGEIICKGNNVFMGYSNNFEDLKKKNTKTLKLKTGDLGYFDKDGFFFISSRKSKIAKIFGIRIDLGVLENLLSQKNYKVSCTTNNKMIFAYFEKNYNKSRLCKLISDITKLNVKYLTLIKLKSFPRTSNNKISYRKLNDMNDKL